MEKNISQRLEKAGIEIPKQNNYEVAFRDAARALSGSSIDDIAEKAGATLINYNGRQSLSVSFLNDELIVTHPEISLSYRNRDTEVPFWLQILALHYLVTARGTPVKDDEITYKQIEGGLSYFTVFQKRTVTPIIKIFSDDFEKFLKAGESLGGRRSTLGDFSLTFQAFPRVAVTFVIWKGDDEFPPEGNVIFNSSITDYLTSEDITMLCNMITVLIIKGQK